jgi:chromosome segregation ATPase
MIDILEQLKEKADRAQTPKSRDFYRSTKAEIERLRADNAVIQGIAVRFEADTERLRTEIERLQAERDRNISGLIEYEKKCIDLMAEVGRLRPDKAAISQTASDYLHEIERLRDEVVRVAALGVPGF